MLPAMRGMTRTLLAACLMLLAIAGPASASVETAGGYKYVTEKSEIKESRFKLTKVKVECPKQTHVLSGSMTSKNAGYADMSYGGAPYDGKDGNQIPDDGWRAEALSYADRKLKIEGRAVCSTEQPFYMSSTTSVPGSSQKNVSVLCPEATAPISGSVSGLVVMNASYPSGGTWVLWADNYDAGPQNVRSTAVCLGGVTSVDTSPGGNVPAGSQSVSFMGCSTGWYGVGGGQSNASPFGEIGMRTASTGPGGFGMALDSYNDGWSYTGYVVCRGPVA
jgi:hypothetical protein